MGRKSVEKDRKLKTKKVEKWTQELVPRLAYVELGSLTMDDLAKLLNKSKSTVYQYFTTKEEIFEYITQVRIDALVQYKNELNKQSDDIRYHYEGLAMILSEGARDISPYYLHQLKINFPTAWKIIEDFLYTLLKDLKLFYEKGMSNNLFKPISIELLHKLDQYFIMQLITDYHFFNETETSLGEMIKDYMFLKFEGLNK